MKTRTSIKNTEFVSAFHTSLGLNKSGVKSFVSAIRNNSLKRIKDKQLEQKDSKRPEALLGSNKQGRDQKLACSLIFGFEKIVSTYNSFFRTGQKTQQDNAQQYL